MSEEHRLADRRHEEDASRRQFLGGVTATAAGALAAQPGLISVAYAAPSGTLRVGLVGCGGRGIGAAVQALKADGNTRLVAMADAFEDKVNTGAERLSRSPVADRVDVPTERRFAGFDAYQKVIESGVDIVLLATPPHFRPQHLRACIEAGKHVFAEKPVAVDAPGVRSVLETTELAKRKGLFIVSGLNSRYSHRMRATMEQIHGGRIGEIVALETHRYGGGVWTRARKPGMSEMEYQMRNWYYFTWLSGDFIVEQFIHQLDRAAWVMGDAYPARAHSSGGRIARDGEHKGHIYDHFNTVYEYDTGVKIFAGTRHWRGCSNVYHSAALGTDGRANITRQRISGKRPWAPEKKDEKDSHQLEHDAFFAALRNGDYINNGEYMAKSTLMAILGREAAYTGETLTWEQMLNSEKRYAPAAYAWDAEPPEMEVPIPGVTEFA